SIVYQSGIVPLELAGLYQGDGTGQPIDRLSTRPGEPGHDGRRTESGAGRDARWVTTPVPADANDAWPLRETQRQHQTDQPDAGIEEEGTHRHTEDSPPIAQQVPEFAETDETDDGPAHEDLERTSY